MNDRSKVLKSKHFDWDGVGVREYGQDGDHFKAISRRTLMGESEGQESLNFVTRYFEIDPGGYSSLEFHQHPHAVVVIRGRGQVLLDGSTYSVEPHDCVFVSPGTTHQFRAAGGRPFGFLCIVDRRRDKPVRARIKRDVKE
jgi:quercetin dioxygenase-like cupin family protein